MASEDELAALHADLMTKQADVDRTGDEVRALKGALKEKKVDKSEVDKVVAKLTALKLELKKSEEAYKAKAGVSKDSSEGRKKFRENVSNALERRLFYIPAFKIYGGIAGLYDYGPPGCAVKANILQFWRQHYVMEENMLEVECPCVTPEVVLKASGHVEKFTDLMVKDLKTLACYRADHLLKVRNFSGSSISGCAPLLAFSASNYIFVICFRSALETLLK